MNPEVLKKLHDIELEMLDEVVRICHKYQLTYFLIEGTLLGAVRHSGFIPWDDDLDIAMPRKDYEQFLAIASQELPCDRYELHYISTDSKYWLCFAKIRKKGTIYLQKNQVESSKQGVWIDIFPLDNVNDLRTDQKQKQRIKWARRLHEIMAFRGTHADIVEQRLSLKVLYVITFLVPIKWLSMLSKLCVQNNNSEESSHIINVGSAYGIEKQTIPREYYFPPKQLMFEGKYYSVPNNYRGVLERVYGNYMELPPIEKRITHNPVRIKI